MDLGVRRRVSLRAWGQSGVPVFLFFYLLSVGYFRVFSRVSQGKICH